MPYCPPNSKQTAAGAPPTSKSTSVDSTSIESSTGLAVKEEPGTMHAIGGALGLIGPSLGTSSSGDGTSFTNTASSSRSSTVTTRSATGTDTSTLSVNSSAGSSATGFPSFHQSDLAPITPPPSEPAASQYSLNSPLPPPIPSSSALSSSPPPDPRRHAASSAEGGAALLSRVRARSQVPSSSNNQLQHSMSTGNVPGVLSWNLGAMKISTFPGESIGSKLDAKGKGRADNSLIDPSIHNRSEFEEYNNSARFYYHQQVPAAPVSPTFHNSQLPIALDSSSRSPKPEPPRRNFSLPAGSLDFPFDTGQAVTLPYETPHHLVVLTPTTQEWKELYQYGSFSSVGDNMAALAQSENGMGSSDEDDEETPSDDVLLWETKKDGRSVLPRPILSTIHSVDLLSHHEELPSFDPLRPSTMLVNQIGRNSSLDVVPVPAPSQGLSAPLQPGRDGSRSAPPVLCGEEAWVGMGYGEGEEGWRLVGESLEERRMRLEAEEGMRLLAEARQQKKLSRLQHDASRDNTSLGVRQIGTGMSLGDAWRPLNQFVEDSDGEDHDEVEQELGGYSSSTSQHSTSPGQHHLSTSPPPAVATSRSRASSILSQSQHFASFMQRPPMSPRKISRSSMTRSSSSTSSNTNGNQVDSLSLPSNSGYVSESATPPLSPRISRRRQSQRLSQIAGRQLPSPFPLANAIPTSASQVNFSAFQHQQHPPINPNHVNDPKPMLQNLRIPLLAGEIGRMSSTSSNASVSSSVTPPSDLETSPRSTRGKTIDDYVIESEAGRGAYGLVKRARRKGPLGEPEGDEVIIKMIIKQRILADSWKKHRVLGPIPIEIHVMEQLRSHRSIIPTTPKPWDPHRPHTELPEEGKGNFAVVTPKPDGEVTTPTMVVDQSLPPYDQSTVRPTRKSSVITLSPLNSTVKTISGHPNICSMVDFFEDPSFYFLVMPRFGSGQDLFDRVEGEPNGLPPFECRSLLGQITDAVGFLHQQGIVHRDIKDENVILDGEGNCQLIDFGSAAHWKPGRMWDTFSGTLDYASPEILRGETYSGKEQDMWALGVVAYVLLCGETPFISSEEAMAGLSPPARSWSALNDRCISHPNSGREADGGGSLGDAADFVQRCLEMDLIRRPTAEQALNHRFISGNGGWTGHCGWLEASVSEPTVE